MECEALLVLVWVGCHCTGHLFPILKKTNSEADLGHNKLIWKNDTEIYSLNISVSGSGREGFSFMIPTLFNDPLWSTRLLWGWWWRRRGRVLVMSM